MIGALDRKWAAEDDAHNALRLDEAAKRIAASEEVMQSFMAPLAAKIEHAAAAAEAAVRNASTCFQRVSDIIGIHFGVSRYGQLREIAAL